MLSERSKQIRRESIKLMKGRGAHYGGTFSSVEILISLYDHVLTSDDTFILSKGHACWAYYVFLREKGFNPILESHPHIDLNNGIPYTTGSEGHGFPAAVGMALARKILNKKGHYYVLVGDGECQEGTTWESLLLSSHHKLNNLTVIVDLNGIQNSGFVKDILPIDCIGAVSEACGWNVIEVDGHNIEQLQSALTTKTNKPNMIIAKTIKGKGVSFMENIPDWHCKWPNKDQEATMLKELE
jgi:transketolase